MWCFRHRLDYRFDMTSITGTNDGSDIIQPGIYNYIYYTRYLLSKKTENYLHPGNQ